MDRKQMVTQRARDYFGERLDDVVHMARQDRHDMRGWEEPAHVRAVVRRTMRQGANQEPEFGTAAVSEVEIGRTAGEPERGQQREAMGQLLEVGASALEKVARQHSGDLTPAEVLGLECVLLVYGRPALEVSQGHLGTAPPFWNIIEDQREDIEMAQRGVGRIELFGHPEYDWAGTGFLASDNCLMTTRHTAECFVENQNGSWQFRPGITAWMDYRSHYQPVASAGYQVRSIIGVHDKYDLALLEVEPPQQLAHAPTSLALAAQEPSSMNNRPCYLIGYPVRDARRNEPETITRIFRDVYNVKRVQPGMVRGCTQFREVHLLHHDCAPLGQSGGSCLFDLETHQVLGMHLYNRYLENSTAIPLWMLRDDPLLRRAGITFSDASSQELEMTANQMERLARTRYWSEVRSVINGLYQRAFGSWNNETPKAS